MACNNLLGSMVKFFFVPASDQAGPKKGGNRAEPELEENRSSYGLFMTPKPNCFESTPPLVPNTNAEYDGFRERFFKPSNGEVR